MKHWNSIEKKERKEERERGREREEERERERDSMDIIKEDFNIYYLNNLHRIDKDGRYHLHHRMQTSDRLWI